MQKIVYNVDGVVETIYDPSIKTIVVTWTTFSAPEHLRPCLEAQVECVQRDGAKVILVDTAITTGVLEQVDQEWLGTYVFPIYQEYGVKAVITVLPESGLTTLAARQWQKTGSDFGVDFVDAASLKVALEQARQYIQQDLPQDQQAL